ncbi:MAG: 4-hydroxy-tetrahydrodipicolinate reductase [Sedimentisphaerales bacterium]|nr:4-hydroxy-tetrahydrodipicolinate reductase [Sedimentisphaerales bacterium]
MTVKLLVVGAGGRMGRRIVALAVESGEFEIAGAVEAAGHPDIGKDAGHVAGVGAIGVKLDSGFPAGADVAIDFSLPEAAGATVGYCVENNVSLVLGTTGLGNEERAKVLTAAKKIPIIYGTNMSVGMNVLFNVVGRVASMLGEDYDIEIVEQHHRFKKDAPSGSALTLAENISRAAGRDFPACIVDGRSGKETLRKKGEIGMHAVRAGDITGEHCVMFGGLGETVTLGHTANSRDTFVRGALRAAKWLVGRKPGLYSMSDVLGIV